MGIARITAVLPADSGEGTRILLLWKEKHASGDHPIMSFSGVDEDFFFFCFWRTMKAFWRGMWEG